MQPETKRSCSRLADNVDISCFRGLSLKEYASVCSADCQSRHTQPCSVCAALLSVANCVEWEGHTRLSTAFKMAFPSQAYKTDIARQRTLQMPLACIRVAIPESVKAAWFLVEYVDGVNYNFAQLAEALFGARPHSQTVGIGSGEIKTLLGLAQSDREGAYPLLHFQNFRIVIICVLTTVWIRKNARAGQTCGRMH